MIELICKELGVKVGEEWTGNDGKFYSIGKDGKLTNYAYKEDGRKSYTDGIERVLSGELKPKWKPLKGDIVWVISLEEADKVVRREWLYYSSKYDERAFNRGLVFKTKEEAEEMANKILEFVKEAI